MVSASVDPARLASVICALERFATSHPDEPAVLAGDRAWSWRELHARAQQWSAELAAHGETTVVVLPADGDALALLAACEDAGLRAVLVAPPYTEAHALALRTQLGARRAVTATGGALRVLAADDATPPATPDAPVVAPAVLVLTSGTTGAPKCAVHTWATLGAASKQRGAYAAQRWQIAYPLSHFAALQVLAQCVFNRGTLVIPRDFSAPAGLAALRDHRVDYLCATPTYVRQLLRASSAEDWDAMTLAHVTMGGEIVDQPLLDALRGRRPSLKLTHTYASTELGAVLSVRDGRAGFDAALVDGETLDVRDGQLYVRRSPRAMLGYAGTASPAGDWVATGDLVEVLDGRVLFRGRTTDVINIGGFKVSPLVVETVIREVAGVRDVLVVGHKSSITGNLVKAVVCADGDVDHASLKDTIARRCAAQLPAYMVPRLFEFRDELEHAASQKLSRVPG